MSAHDETQDKAQEQVRREIQFRAAEAAAKAGRARNGWDGGFPTAGASEARERLAAYYEAMAWEWTAILELTDVPGAGDNGRTPEESQDVARIPALDLVDADVIANQFFCLYPRCAETNDPKNGPEIATHMRVKHGVALPVRGDGTIPGPAEWQDGDQDGPGDDSGAGPC